MDFILFILFLLCQRITELLITKRNEKWLLSQGAIEYGKEHYTYMILLHILFFVALIAEYLWRGHPSINYILLALYAVVVLLKVWTISSLGKYWNIKVFRVPETFPIKRGPYKYMRHPNYLLVIAEILVIPMMFHLYYTFLVFSLLNLIIIRIRVKTENTVWDYE
jgi:methyltransferase